MPAPALARSLHTVDATIRWCSYRLGLPGVQAASSGWLRCADALADPEFFTRWKQEVTTRMADGRSTVPPVTPAAHVMGWYAGLFGHLGGALFHRCRRVVSLAPEALAFRADPVWRRPVELAVLDPAFRCLPEDPDAGDADATVLPDEAALAAALRAEVVAHGARFVSAYRGGSRFGRRTLWGAVTDAVDRGVWHAARRGDEPRGAADAALVLPCRLPPFTSGSTIRAVHGATGTVHWTRVRQSCCFHYKLPGAAPCPTCPRLTDTERIRLLDTEVQ